MNVNNETENIVSEPVNVQPTDIVNHISTNVRDGESVKYAQKPEWHAVRATFGRAKKGEEFFNRQGLETFLPTKAHKIFHHQGDKLTVDYVNKPLLSNIFFVRAHSDTLKELFRTTSCPPFITPYYNHCLKDNQGNNPLLRIPDTQMESFIKLVESRNEHIMLADPSNKKFHSGQLVRVTDGEFKGVIGRVARHKGQQRVFVNIENLCMVATAYIPTPYLEALS